MSKFTPGPWFNCGEGHIKSKHKTICWVEKGPQAPNARLISKAPEMFELLKDFISGEDDKNAEYWNNRINTLLKQIEG